jgi:hypothetical protein
MCYRWLERLVLTGSTALFLFGASKGAWKQKDFKDWSNEDAQAIMTDSPWAKEIPMPAAARPDTVVVEPGASGGAPPTASLGNPSNGSTGINMTVAGNAGSAGPADPNGTHSLPTAQTPSGMAPSPGAPEPRGTVRIVWASAAPVRLAILKLRSGRNAPLEPQIENATKPPKDYVLAVSGLLPPDRDFDPASVARKASLSMKGVSPVLATEVRYRQIGNSDVYFFHFDRAALTIAGGTGQIEFKMQLGKVEVKRKFDLGEMHYQGHLAL